VTAFFTADGVDGLAFDVRAARVGVGHDAIEVQLERVGAGLRHQAGVFDPAT